MLIRPVGEGEHAACLLDPDDRRRWIALASPAAVAELARVRRTLDGSDPATGARLDRARDRLLMGALAPEPPPAGEVLTGALAVTAALGRRAFDLDRALLHAREIQRSGFLGGDEWIGDLFGPLLVIAWAGRAGFQVDGACEALLGGRRGRDLRHYRDCPALPHDADVAAAVLDALAVDGGGGAAGGWARQRARAILAEAVGADGAVRTWVDLPGEARRVGDHPWLGPRCSGVAGRALAAMAGDGQGFDDGRIQSASRWLAARREPDGGFRGVHYPDGAVATALALSGLAAARGRLGADGDRDAAIAAAADWLLDTQRSDGRFGGGTLSTAMAVLALADAARAGAPVEPAEAWADALARLAVSQRWDGSWPADGLYLCPHPGGRVGRFGSSSLTGAAALAALGIIRASRAG